MTTQFKIQLLQRLTPQKTHKGFTLLELLIIVIIIGILVAIALPNLLSQVSKGRQAEAKTNLSALLRAQQAYYFEESTFANDINNLSVKVSWKYYEITGVMTTTKDFFYLIDANSTYNDDILNYAGGITKLTGGRLKSTICEEKTLNTATASQLIVSTSILLISNLDCSSLARKIQ